MQRLENTKQITAYNKKNSQLKMIVKSTSMMRCSQRGNPGTIKSESIVEGDKTKTSNSLEVN